MKNQSQKDDDQARKIVLKLGLFALVVGLVITALLIARALTQRPLGDHPIKRLKETSPRGDNK
jgi:hypothetical protein